MVVRTISYPDKRGYFGEFGGRFLPETLMQPLLELEAAYSKIKTDKKFWNEYRYLLTHYIGRPTPLYEAERFAERVGKCRILLKREDLNHTGSHKINNALGQALLARKMGKKRIIAETGAGQHGVAIATACALLGLECIVYMGEEDIHRQALNVYRMDLLGAKVVPVASGTKTLKDAVNEALRDWVTNPDTTYYALGSVVGPHPYPMLVRDFQCVIGNETRAQSKKEYGKLPDILIACVGGGSNSIGFFHPFIGDKNVQMIGVEAEGAASLSTGSPGVLHGTYSFLLQDKAGQVLPTASIAAGLDYPGVGPEHSWLQNTKRAQYVNVGDEEAPAAFRNLCTDEGIIPALESSHALAYAEKLAPTLSKNKTIAICLSGRGDKDVGQLK